MIFFGGGQEDYFGPGIFFLCGPEPGYYFLLGTVLDFFIRDNDAYKNKQKSLSIDSDLEMDMRLIKCLVL